MLYICPNKACKRRLNLSEGFYRGGTLFYCDRCNETATIPLYCSTCDPPGKQEKKYLHTPAGLLGGQSFRCGSGHTFVVPVLRDEVHSRLNQKGRRIGADFEQRARIALLPQKEKALVSAGYCEGAAMDWIRRALLGGKFSFSEDKASTNIRAVRSHTTLDQMDSFIAGQQTKLVNHGNNLVENYDQDLLDLQTRTAAAAEKIGTLPPELRAEASRRVTEKYQQQAQELLDRVPRLHSQLEQWKQSPKMKRFWAEYSTQMDAHLASERKARGKSGPSSRGFGRLEIKKVVEDRAFNGISNFIIELLKDPEFQANRAALAIISPPTGAAGHAVGILRQNTGRYLLFEPNFGAYALIDARALADAIIYLFGTAYPNMPVGGDAHIYEIGGTISGRYTIFEGLQPPVTAVNQLLQPTQ